MMISSSGDGSPSSLDQKEAIDMFEKIKNMSTLVNLVLSNQTFMRIIEEGDREKNNGETTSKNSVELKNFHSPEKVDRKSMAAFKGDVFDEDRVSIGLVGDPNMAMNVEKHIRDPSLQSRAGLRRTLNEEDEAKLRPRADVAMKGGEMVVDMAAQRAEGGGVKGCAAGEETLADPHARVCMDSRVCVASDVARTVGACVAKGDVSLGDVFASLVADVDGSKTPLNDVGNSNAIPNVVKKSYASVVNNQTKVINDFSPIVNLPDPIIRGEKIIIEIPDKVYDNCIAMASNDLIGRIQYKKGDKPYLLKDVKNRLKSLWNLENDWKLAPIGRGFFYCRFASNEDKLLAWTKGMVKLNPGFFKLIKWSPNFNPYNYQSSMVNTWIKIIGLSGELFHSDIMFRIAKGVGTPISIDNVSANFELANYARVLVEVDASQKLPTLITICIKGVEHEIVIEYENLPQFCDHCLLIGHSKYDCLKLRKSIDERKEREVVQHKRARVRQEYAPKNKKEDENMGKNNVEAINDKDWEMNKIRKGKASAKDQIQGNIQISNSFGCLNNDDEIFDEEIEMENKNGEPSKLNENVNVEIARDLIDNTRDLKFNASNLNGKASDLNDENNASFGKVENMVAQFEANTTTNNLDIEKETPTPIVGFPILGSPIKSWGDIGDEEDEWKEKQLALISTPRNELDDLPNYVESIDDGGKNKKEEVCVDDGGKNDEVCVVNEQVFASSSNISGWSKVIAKGRRRKFLREFESNAFNNLDDGKKVKKLSMTIKKLEESRALQHNVMENWKPPEALGRSLDDYEDGEYYDNNF